MTDMGWAVVAAIVVFFAGLCIGWGIHADAWRDDCAAFGGHRVKDAVYLCMKQRPEIQTFPQK
jgi:hypothetical protein